MIAENRIRHDFKNHLSIILGFAELLLADSPANEVRRGDLEQIRTAATAALDLLARLYPGHDDPPL